MKRDLFVALVYCVCMLSPMAAAAPFPVMGGMPGMAQIRAIGIQRHQARTLLYREALEELRRNPQAADVPECPPIQTTTRILCIRRPATLTTVGSVAENGTDISATQATTHSTQGIKPTPIEIPPMQIEDLSSTISKAVGRRRIAVLVGNNGYKEPIPVLRTPIADIEQIAEVLRNHFGYETQILHDASKMQIIQALNKIAEEAKPEDSVLLFYAGHGYLMDDTNMGFWIPVDGSANSPVNWISNTDISKLLHAISSRQVILVSDSCFSGSLTREQKLTGLHTTKAAEILRQRTVLVLSSGGEEPVSDGGKDGHSIFAWHLIKALGAVKGGTVGFEIYRTVHNGVIKDYPQVPQYGAVFSAGHVSGGEYLFDAKQ